MSWTSGETITANRLEDKNDRNTASGYAGLDGTSKVLLSTIPLIGNAQINATGAIQKTKLYRYGYNYTTMGADVTLISGINNFSANWITTSNTLRIINLNGTTEQYTKYINGTRTTGTVAGSGTLDTIMSTAGDDLRVYLETGGAGSFLEAHRGSVRLTIEAHEHG